MSLQNPLKLLEINVISAQDLPPVSKMLRTFVVAWLQPDQKLTTRVDYKGHTNPTWNYKLVFPLEDNILSMETTTLTIQIYNVAWLRDIPIGTACVPIKNLIQPTPKNAGSRPIMINIARPSGLLQGILNVGVNFIDCTKPSMPLYSELSFATTKNGDDRIDNNNSEKMASPEIEISKIKLQRSKSEMTSSHVDGYSFQRTTSMSNGSKIGLVKQNILVSNASMCSMMHPLPSEVAARLQKGVYSTHGNDYGSSIFENWTVAGNRAYKSDDVETSRLVRWRAVDQGPLIEDGHTIRHKSDRRRKSKSDGGGLLSCFGNAYGFEFSIICGNDVKKNRKKILSKTNPREKLLQFHG